MWGVSGGVGSGSQQLQHLAGVQETGQGLVWAGRGGGGAPRCKGQLQAQSGPMSLLHARLRLPSVPATLVSAGRQFCTDYGEQPRVLVGLWVSQRCWERLAETGTWLSRDRTSYRLISPLVFANRPKASVVWNGH